MDVRLVCEGGLERHEIEDLPRLLQRRDAVVWVDIPICDQQAVDVLSGVFGFHPIAVRDCTERNHVSKVHIYPEYVFSVLHAPKLGQRGHVHYVELDQFVGPNYLVTVHGPLNPAVDARGCLHRHQHRDPPARRRDETSPKFAVRVVVWIVSAMIRRESDLVADLATRIGTVGTAGQVGEDLDDDPGGAPGGPVRGLVRAPRGPHHRHAQRETYAAWPASSGSCRTAALAAVRRHRDRVRRRQDDGRRPAGVRARRHRLLPDPDLARI